MHVTEQICKELTDLEIVQKSLHDVEYFACLYKKYEPKLLRYINRISYSTREESEDILQEAFIKIWRNLNDFDQSLKLSSWIYRIVHNETVSFWRKKTSYGQSPTIELPEEISVLEQDSLGEEQEQFNKSKIDEVLQKLPLKYREILVLKFLEMMSYDEISDVLKIPEGTVATRINRAKKAFIQQGGKETFSWS